ncbi:Integral membrane protein [Pleurostoma richardsiae]|uniref:Integral membrane protein n=1 Tax=Pleurostoma richardsiae TaxID=41990 RepID=A0AA38RUL3_9PEZI|nr:Integral membrane protein [Pleurostoma richardsiae]
MAFKNVVEPGFIVFAFTVGALINRRRTYRDTDDLEARAPLIDRRTSADTFSYTRFLKSWPQRVISELDLDRKHNDNWASRFLAKFPFLMEIWYWNWTYWSYQLMRALSAKLIRGNKAVFALAESHAIKILHLEQALGIDIEQRFQQYILTKHPWLMSILANVYYSHISLGICFIIYTYTFLPPQTFQRIRRTIAVDNYIAFVILTLWRCAPPRLLPPEYGFVDVLHKSANQGTAWNNNSFQLTIAAMPSLHCGTAFFLAFCMVRYSPHRILRILAPLWPAAMIVTIIATANHFVLDAVVGTMVPFLGWRLNRVVLIFEPWEDWLFSLLRIEKPIRSSGTETPIKDATEPYD